jgi:superfamily II DNA helicase RecQ
MSSIHCFAVPALNPEPAQSDLNQFLATERVLAMRREFIADGANSCWVFCVELAQGAGPLPDALKVPGSRAGAADPARGRGGIDYKQVLSETDFALFAALRDLRKQLAMAEGVPVFAVFTNEQLAAIVTQHVHSKAEMGAIDGIGPARLDKYGDAVLACLQGQRVVPSAQPPALQPAPQPATS